MSPGEERVAPHQAADDGPLFAPEVEQDDRDLLARFSWTLKPMTADPSTSAVRIYPGSDALLSFGLAAVGLGVVAYVVLAGLMVLITTGLSPGYNGAGYPLRVALAFVGAGGLSIVGSQLLRTPIANQSEARAADRARALHGSYILPRRDLDEEARALLRRARAVAQRIADEQARTDLVIDAVDTTVRLSESVWRLAIELVDLSQKRAQIADAVKELAESDREQAAKPYRRSVNKTQQALEKRVRGMEAAADAVDELDRLAKRLEAARRLEEVDPRIDLASNRAVRDAVESESISTITDEIAAARESVESALGEHPASGVEQLKRPPIRSARDLAPAVDALRSGIARRIAGRRSPR